MSERLESSTTRRRFVSCTALVSASILLSGRALVGNASQGATYRIQPLPDRSYSQGFLDMCSERLFSSPQDAVMSVRDEETEFLVIKILI